MQGASLIPEKQKNETATAPSRFFKKKEKNRTSRRRLNTNGTTPLQVIPFGRALWYSSSSLLFESVSLSMYLYYIIFVEFARCVLVQCAVKHGDCFVHVAQSFIEMS